MTLLRDNDLILDLHGAESPVDLEQHLAAFVSWSTPVDAPVDDAPVGHYVRLEPVRRLLRNPDGVRPCVAADNFTDLRDPNSRGEVGLFFHESARDHSHVDQQGILFLLVEIGRQVKFNLVRVPVRVHVQILDDGLRPTGHLPPERPILLPNENLPVIRVHDGDEDRVGAGAMQRVMRTVGGEVGVGVGATISCNFSPRLNSNME